MGFGKVNPKASAGKQNQSDPLLTTSTPQSSVIRPNTNIASIQYGIGSNSLLPTGSKAGSLYSGNGIQVTGASDNNIVFFNGGNLVVSNTLSLSAVSENVTINPGSNGSVTAYTQSTVIGGYTSDVGTANTIIGYSAKCTVSGSGNVVVGTSASCNQQTNSVAIGNDAYCSNSGTYSVALGYAANTQDTNSIAIGYSASAAINHSIAIGNICTVTTNTYGIAIGSGSYCSGQYGISLGYGTNTSTYGATGAQAIAIGYESSASASYSISIGGGNPISNASYGVGLGYQASTSGTYALALGSNSQASATQSIGIGYATNAAQANTIAMGSESTTDFIGEINICNAGFANTGDIHTSHFPLQAYTTSATAVEFQTNGGNLSTAPAHYMVLSNNASYAFTIDIVAQTTGGTTDCAMWSTQFLIQRKASASTTALVGTPSGLTTPLFATTGATSGAWAVAVTADATNGRPAIKVTGSASTNISWVANVKMTKVGY